MRPAIALLVLVPALAACLAPAEETPGASSFLPVELPLADVTKLLVENLTLSRPDGAALAMTVFRPDTDEKVPVLLVLSPYFNSGSTTWTLNAPDRRLAEYFAPHGYAVVQAAVRGTGDSTGCFSIGGYDEQEDAAAMVDFLGELPWTNGNVAMVGKSYVGTTPWEAAILKPKHLKAIVPISGITDMYRYMFYNGTILYPWGAHFLMYYGADEDLGLDPLGPAFLPFAILAGADPVRAASGYVEPAEFQRSAADAARCGKYAEMVAHQYLTDGTGDHDAFWDERDYSPRLGEIEAAVFLVHGWQDWNVKPDHIARVWEKINAPKVAWVGQWYHDYPDINRYRKDWERHDWNATLLQFFDATLKGVENGFFDRPAFESQDQLGIWRREATWPPGGPDLVLRLGEGTLTEEEAGATVLSYVGDPTRHPGPDAGAGSLAFLSNELTEPLRVAGIPQVDLRITPKQPGGHVAVVLYNVSKDGVWTPLDTGFLDLRHAGSRDAGALVVPGAAMDVRVEMFPQDLVILPGERIGLVVAGEFPADPDDPLEGWTSGWPIYAWPGPTAYDLDTGASALRLPTGPV